MALSDITDPSAVWKAIAEFDQLGRADFLAKYGFRPAREYFVVAGGRRYDSKAIAGAAHGYQFPEIGPLKAREFSGGDATVRRLLSHLGFQVEGPKEGISAERERRHEMRRALTSAGWPNPMNAGAIREIGVYGGAQGIWVDQARTGTLTPGNIGVAVAVLHTGERYSDELTEDGLIYHYPETNRPGDRDRREADALKYAGEYQLPVFVILGHQKPSLRIVREGWVADFDDEAKQCLVLFGELPKAPPLSSSKEPFRLTANRAEKNRQAKERIRSPRFRFEVLKEYGERCAFCDIEDPRLLEAAHIRSVSKNGSDHPQNGLVLCANNHKAFDKGLITIEPTTYYLVARPSTFDLRTIGVSRDRVAHLRSMPHQEAIEWRWAHRGLSLEDADMD